LFATGRDSSSASSAASSSACTDTASERWRAWRSRCCR